MNRVAGVCVCVCVIDAADRSTNVIAAASVVSEMERDRAAAAAADSLLLAADKYFTTPAHRRIQSHIGRGLSLVTAYI